MAVIDDILSNKRRDEWNSLQQKVISDSCSVKCNIM